jgi:hypothetical protein
LLQARPPFYTAPCDALRSSTLMRTDRLLLPTCFDYEYPRLAASQHLFEAYASPLGRGLATQTHETGGPSVSRRSIRFGGPPGLMRGVFLPRTPEPAEPLAPLSPPHSPSLRFRTSGAFWGRLDSAANPSVKIEVSYIRPRCLPSTRDTRARARAVADLDVRSRDGFPLRSGPRRPFIRSRCAPLLAIACWLRARLPSPYALPIG